MNKIAVSVIAVSALIGLSPFLVDQYSLNTFDTSFNANGTSINTSGNFTKRIGVVTGNTLQFGSIPAGAASIKYLSINASQKALLLVSSTGNISDALTYPEKLYFEGSKQAPVRFNATEPGYYTGTVDVKIQTARNTLGQKWLDLKASLPALLY